MRVTKCDVKVNFRNYGELFVPKGTRITNMTACGVDQYYNFVDEFGWIPSHADGTKQHGLHWDATYYGINIDPKFIEEKLNADTN